MNASLAAVVYFAIFAVIVVVALLKMKYVRASGSSHLGSFELEASASKMPDQRITSRRVIVSKEARLSQVPFRTPPDVAETLGALQIRPVDIRTGVGRIPDPGDAH